MAQNIFNLYNPTCEVNLITISQIMKLRDKNMKQRILVRWVEKLGLESTNHSSWYFLLSSLKRYLPPGLYFTSTVLKDGALNFLSKSSTCLRIKTTNFSYLWNCWPFLSCSQRVNVSIFMWKLSIMEISP